jgi:AcrR family transcriptional regulator
VAERAEKSVPGLRERKKHRTRATLIDAAMALCLKNGYENITVEQIAADADVSPRTFSRYFATKDAVFLTLIEDYAHEVAIEFEKVPTDVGPLEAMRQAHVAVLTRVSSGQVGRISTDRIILMLRVINASATLRQAAFEFRHDVTEAILAKRMGVDLDDPKARLVSVVFSATIVTACGDLIADTDTVRLGPTVMVDRLNEAFGQVAVMASDLHAPAPASDYEQVYG